jgi:regulator of sigma E protease
MLSPLILFPLAAGSSYALAILGIGFLIFVHELGHYLACRLTKTRVETFSIGFGTRLFGWESRPGEPRRFTVGRRRLDPAENAMDFRVALVPLGGYVKMAGENPGEDRTGAADEFPGKPMWARVFIISAGVIMNALTAWLFYFIAFTGHIEQEPAIAGLVDPGGAAWAAGMEPGDRVLSMDGTRTRSFQDLKMETVFLAPDEAVSAVVERGGQQKTLRVTPRYDDEIGAILLKIKPAAQLTLTEGEKKIEIGPVDAVRVDGVPVRGGFAVEQVLHEALRGGEQPRVTLETADGTQHELLWKPGVADPEAKPLYKIGIERYAQPSVKAVRSDAAHTFQSGDRLVAALSGTTRYPITSPSDAMRLPWRAPVDGLEIQRGPQTLTIRIQGDTPEALAASLLDLSLDWPDGASVRPLTEGALSFVGGRVYRYPGIPSAAAGLVAGDRIFRIAGRDVNDWNDILEAIGRVESVDPLEVRVVGQDDEERTLTIVPVVLEPFDGPEISAKFYVEPYPSEGVIETAGAALARTGREVKNIFRLIGAFFTGSLSFNKNVGGPVTIVKFSARAADRDSLSFFVFLAYISITLAVLNILPIPVLDGGHLMFILIEKIKGSPLTDETLGKLQFVGLMLLLLLMVFAFKNDFQNLLN